MKKRKYKKILNTIAQKEGINVTEVEREMQIAILWGYINSDSQVQRMWEEIRFHGTYPTPKDVISYLVQKANCKNI